MYPSGSRGSPAKGVVRETAARVQISPSAPNGGRGFCLVRRLAMQEKMARFVGRGRQFIGQRTPAVRGARDERAQRRARAVTENGALLTPFEKANGVPLTFYEPPFSKGGTDCDSKPRGDLPLRDKARSSESSISKTPAAFLWGQILQPRCARQLPLLKGALLWSTWLCG